MNEYDNLKDLSVYQLRTLARSVGVGAPTTKTVDVLIKEILDIKNGVLKPQKSKMGRPPKNKATAIDTVFEVNEVKTLANLGYEPINLFSNLMLESDEAIGNLAYEKQNFWGVVRDQNGQLFLKDYSNNFDYVRINSIVGEIIVGDLICGKAKEGGGSVSTACEYKKYVINNLPSKTKIAVKSCKNVSDMYEYISNQEGINFIVEVEANKRLIKAKDGDFVFSTDECDDIIKSYNMLCDIKNMVKILVNENRKFTLYLVNVEYIYSILSMYYNFKKEIPDMNAGQYFKELLSMINESEFGSIIMMQKEASVKNDYLNIIIDKYCTKID